MTKVLKILLDGWIWFIKDSISFIKGWIWGEKAIINMMPNDFGCLCVY